MQKQIDQRLRSALQESTDPFNISYGIDQLLKAGIEARASAELDKMNPQYSSASLSYQPKII